MRSGKDSVSHLEMNGRRLNSQRPPFFSRKTGGEPLRFEKKAVDTVLSPADLLMINTAQIFVKLNASIEPSLEVCPVCGRSRQSRDFASSP
jgi:hypothetical protein